MRCPRCWADKAFRRQNAGWALSLLSLLLLVPMRCQHCFHKFWAFRAAPGQKPAERSVPRTS